MNLNRNRMRMLRLVLTVMAVACAMAVSAKVNEKPGINLVGRRRRQRSPLGTNSGEKQNDARSGSPTCCRL